uniref:Uncharacterized protein n=1 Tax=Peromyscus maniculatus bairdii TaxID=230844 RepID=A0A8C8UA40_PERMB
MITVPPPESLLPSRCGDTNLQYAQLLCTWAQCILDERLQRKVLVSEDTQGMDTQGRIHFTQQRHNCGPRLLDTIPATSLRKAIKINVVFKNWSSLLLFRVSKKNHIAALHSSDAPARETRQRIYARSLLPYDSM